jgi:peptidoglycan glycosyltransferase/penicillin-binding protein 2
MKGRLFCLFLVCVVLLSSLVVRLAMIQMANGAKYRQLAEKQSYAELTGICNRGTIYDRNNRPLTNTEDSYIFMIDSRRINKAAEGLLNRLNARRLNNSNNQYCVYSILSIDRACFKILCRDYGAIAAKVRQHYGENQSAIHLIGQIGSSDKQETTGIEKDFDEVLSSGRSSFSVKNDGQGYFIPGGGIRIEGDRREWGVITTLDYDLQKLAEEALINSGQGGALIITDISSGEILASVSATCCDTYPIDEYYDKSEEILKNKAIGCAYPAGMVFSLLSEAAIWENEISNSPEAETIIKTAHAFGFSEEAIETLSGQTTGNLSEYEKNMMGGLSKPADWQEELLITPMQVARMTRMIAEEGRDCGLRAIKGTVEGIKGALMLPKARERQVISTETARMIRKKMEEVFVNKQHDGSEKEGSYAGGWFTGYIPAEEPQFGITVYLEGAQSASATASTVYHRIADSLYSKLP